MPAKSSAASASKSQKLPAGAVYEKDGRVYFVDPRADFPIPNLIEIQQNSYAHLLKTGIADILEEFSPITDHAEKYFELHLRSYEVGKAKVTETEAREKNVSFEAPLTVHLELHNKESGEIKEQDVYFGSVPLMTPRGTFIVNGIERVVVNQIVRSEGAMFVPSGEFTGRFNAKLIPRRGAWLEIEVDRGDTISVKIDRKRKIPLTTFLRAIGYDSDKKILDVFKGVDGEQMAFILNTLEKDPIETADAAALAVHKKIRPGDLATPDAAKGLIQRTFFDPRRYDLGKVGRYRLNRLFDLKRGFTPDERVLIKEDLELVLRELLAVNAARALPSDVDSLENRRIKSVGELVADRFRLGMQRVERTIRDRMNQCDRATVTPHQLINSHPIIAAIREFFSGSQLSQFADMTNPVDELGIKRKINATGPGGLTRERAGFEVRDIHPTHYGRICPTCTPEGPNIGLVLQFAVYSRVNEFGFLETPYRVVKKFVKNDGKAAVGRTFKKESVPGDEAKEISVGGKTLVKNGDKITDKIAAELAKIKDLKEIPVRPYLSDEVAHFDASDEKRLVIAEANAEIGDLDEFANDFVAARYEGTSSRRHVQDVTHIDVSPKQLLSIEASMVPFIENDDPMRTLMASNMQRQGVPLVRPSAPLVGTGMERPVAMASGQMISAPENGEISYADAEKIEMITEKGKRIKFDLMTFHRSNKNTLLHQMPIVRAGDKVSAGDPLVDGAGIDRGELASGRDLLVGFMSWNGFNFEDGIILSDAVIERGAYDSIHIREFTCDIRDTKLGAEEMTRDIPNVSEERLANLDENGVIRVGAEIREGDLLVGKVTPKGETELSAEERLLRAIFGDKASDVRDTSLRVEHGISGKVISVKVYDKDSGVDLDQGVIKEVVVQVAYTHHLEVGDKMAGRHGNKGIVVKIVPKADMPYAEDGTPMDIILTPMGVISRMNIGQLFESLAGRAAEILGCKIASPGLQGLKREQIAALLDEAGLPEDGKVQLFDGLTGDPFVQKTTVGRIYMMKLHHLVAEKIHARATGPYSLITQQPLGGKAQRGGQRFGEMEVWALEAYAANHTLQEILTIKSDDVVGRAKAYEALVAGEDIAHISIPESFRVLTRELKACGLDTTLINSHSGKVYSDEEEEAIIEASALGDAPSASTEADFEKLATTEKSVGGEELPPEEAADATDAEAAEIKAEHQAEEKSE